MWSASTDLEQAQQGPAVILRLSGGAREMRRTLDCTIAAYGATVDLQDGNGPVQITGLATVLRGLSREYAPLDYEASITAMSDLLSFRKTAQESVDISLSRFSSIRQRANMEGQGLPPAYTAYILMKGLHIQPLMWVNFLAPIQGSMPITDVEVSQLIQHIRRQGHLLERGSVLTDSAGSGPAPADSYFGMGLDSHPHPGASSLFTDPPCGCGSYSAWTPNPAASSGVMGIDNTVDNI